MARGPVRALARLAAVPREVDARDARVPATLAIGERYLREGSRLPAMRARPFFSHPPTKCPPVLFPLPKYLPNFLELLVGFFFSLRDGFDGGSVGPPYARDFPSGHRAHIKPLRHMQATCGVESVYGQAPGQGPRAPTLSHGVNVISASGNEFFYVMMVNLIRVCQSYRRREPFSRHQDRFRLLNMFAVVGARNVAAQAKSSTLGGGVSPVVDKQVKEADAFSRLGKERHTARSESVLKRFDGGEVFSSLAIDRIYGQNIISQ